MNISSNIFAQTPHCHADELLSQFIQEHGTGDEIKAYKTSLKNTAAARTGGVVTELPVVFHIIHRGESIGNGSNLSDSKIIEQLDILNEDFAFLNSDRSNIPSQFASFGADTEIQFCLTKVNENGQSSSGIVRHEMPSINSTSQIENSIKPQTHWDPSRFINIWIVRMPDPSILGYAYLPIPEILGTPRDGIVISHLKVGNQNTITKGRTLVHEMGHYLGLLHMWGFDENECNEEDEVSDTPASFAPHYGCPVHPQFTCGTSDMFMNYMDYVNDNCMFMFTEGQKNRMHAIINGQRLSVKNNTNAVCGPSVSTSAEISTSIDFNLYPNPCNEQLNIDLSSELQIVSVDIFNMKGQNVIPFSQAGMDLVDNIQVDTKSLKTGVYVVRIVTESGKILSKRFVRSGL